MSAFVSTSEILRGLRAAFVLALLFVFLGAHAARAEIFEKTSEEVYEVSPTVTLTIHNTDGRICVYGSELPQLNVRAVRRALTKERLEQIKVEVVLKGDTASIETIYPPAPTGSLFADRSGTVDYIILVPEHSTLAKVELANGELVIEGIYGGAIEARLGKGRLQLQNCFAPARLILAQGGADILYDWWDARRFSISTEIGDGDLRVLLPPDAALHLDAATTRGNVRNLFAPGSSGDGSTLETQIGQESAADFKLRTTIGSIRIERAY